MCHVSVDVASGHYVVEEEIKKPPHPRVTRSAEVDEMVLAQWRMELLNYLSSTGNLTHEPLLCQ